jgi:thiamine pyrophosphokinase
MPAARAVIFANGMLPDTEAVKRLLREDDYWIAADGGCRHALACGRAPDILIGDLDSVPDPLRDPLLQAGTKIQPFSVDKDETDLELAVWFALEKGYSSILILAGLGGRTDQTLANLSLLADPALREFDIRMDDGREEAVCIRGKEFRLQGERGDVVSLLPLGVPAEGVVTDGLEFPLRGETLNPFRTRGVSNRLLGDSATISVERGALLCIHTRSKH